MFGDIVNTFGLLVEGGEIGGFDELVAEVEIIGSILGCLAQGDGFSGEGTGHSEVAAVEADPAVLLNDAQQISRRIVEGLDTLAIVPRADTVAICRDGQGDGFVRPSCVVGVAPAIERLLSRIEVLEPGPDSASALSERWKRSSLPSVWG